MLGSLRFSILFAALSLNLALVAQERPAAWKKPSQPVYVVTQNHYAEGFTPQGRTPRFGELVMIEIFNPASTQGAPIFPTGQSYALYTGGQRAGRVVVGRIAPLQCDSLAAVVSTDGFAFASDSYTSGASTNPMALATNASVRTHSNFRRSGDESQKSLLLNLAMAEFRKQGVTVSSPSQIQLDNVIVTAFDSGGAGALLGSARTELDHVRHQVFLVGSLSVGRSAVQLAVYRKTTDLADGKDSQNLRFVDQLDLDSDGIDEIVIEATGYESEEFWILRREAGKWNRVWVGGRGGC